MGYRNREYSTRAKLRAIPKWGTHEGHRFYFYFSKIFTKFQFHK